MRVLRGMINTGSLSLQVKDGQGKAVGIKGQVREGQVKYGFKYIFYQGRVSRDGFKYIFYQGRVSRYGFKYISLPAYPHRGELDIYSTREWFPGMVLNICPPGGHFYINFNIFLYIFGGPARKFN